MCEVLQIRTRKFSICVDEVQYMLKMKHKRRTFTQCTTLAELVHLMHSLNVSHAVRSVDISSHNFGTKKDARSAKCVHLQHRTIMNAVRIGEQKQCTTVH